AGPIKISRIEAIPVRLPREPGKAARTASVINYIDRHNRPNKYAARYAAGRSVVVLARRGGRISGCERSHEAPASFGGDHQETSASSQVISAPTAGAAQRSYCPLFAHRNPTFGVRWLGRTQLRKKTVTRRAESDHAPPRIILYSPCAGPCGLRGSLCS